MKTREEARDALYSVVDYINNLSSTNNTLLRINSQLIIHFCRR